jgi:hypothetical protein
MVVCNHSLHRPDPARLILPARLHAGNGACQSIPVSPHERWGEQPHSLWGEQPHSLWGEQPHSLWGEQPHSLWGEQPHSLWGEQPHSLWGEQPHSLWGEQPHSLWGEQPHSLWGEQPHSLWGEQPHSLWGEQPHSLWGEQPRCNDYRLCVSVEAPPQKGWRGRGSRRSRRYPLWISVDKLIAAGLRWRTRSAYALGATGNVSGG